MTTATEKCTLRVQMPLNFVAFQNTQNWHLLMPIVSSRGSITYGAAKGLANIICPLVGQSPHHLKNTHHFIQHTKEVRLELGEVMTSYDVKALFTSVSVDPSFSTVKQNLQQDTLLSQRTNMSIQQVVTLLEFYLKTHTSSSKVSITNRSMVLPLAPPLAPSLPTCLQKSLKSRPFALTHTPYLWIRYVDDTFVIQEAKHSQQLLQCINSKDSHIQFPIQEPNLEGALPFLDTLVFPSPNNTLATTAYRKPTHTYQYLHWDSNHFIGAKNSTFNTLAFRPKVVCPMQQALHKEMEHIRKALQACNFPSWALHTLQNKLNCKNNIHNGHTTTGTQSDNNNNGSNNKNISIVVPYIHGGGRFKKICNSLGIQVHFKGTNTIKTLLMAPKDRDNKLEKVGLYIDVNAQTTAQRNA